MSAPLVIPFNFDAGTTTRKTTSYTVGSGKYCWAMPLSPACTVNSVAVFQMVPSTVAVSSASTFSLTTEKFTGVIAVDNSATSKEIRYVINASGTFSTGLLSTVGSGASGSLEFVDGMCLGTAVAPNSTSNIIGIAVTLSGAVSTVVTITPAMLFGSWYKASDVLTGGYWLVTEYNSLT